MEVWIRLAETARHSITFMETNPIVDRSTIQNNIKTDSMVSEPSNNKQAPGALLYARILFFCYYMAFGAFFPFINLYYQRIGLTGVQIGTLSSIPLLVMSTTSVLWGGIADVLRLHRRILNIALFLTPIVVFFLSRTTEYSILIPLVIAYAFFSAPIVPLLDNAALEAIETHGGTYGGLRVWGSISWMASTWIVGELIDKFDTSWLFYSYITLMGLTFIFSIFQPVRSKITRSSLGHNLHRLVTRHDFIFFIISILLLAVATGSVNNFFSLYMDGLGAGEGAIGLAWSIAALSEIPVMLLSGTIMRHIGENGLLKISFITYAFRWLVYSFIQVPALVLPLQLLHGFSYGTFQVGGVTYVNNRTPKSMRTTGQAIFTTISYGIGPIIGTLIGGYFYDTVGIATLFRILSVITIVGLSVFLFASKPRDEAGITFAVNQDNDPN